MTETTTTEQLREQLKKERQRFTNVFAEALCNTVTEITTEQLREQRRIERLRFTNEFVEGLHNTFLAEIEKVEPWQPQISLEEYIDASIRHLYLTAQSFCFGILSEQFCTDNFTQEEIFSEMHQTIEDCNKSAFNEIARETEQIFAVEKEEFDVINMHDVI